MMRRSILSPLALLLAVTPVASQPAPFDMSPESDLVIEEAVPEPEQPATSPAEEAPEADEGRALFARNILPGTALHLAGEEAKEGVVVYLTAAQAAAPAKLDFAYLNALVVAPEASNLRIRINQTETGRIPIASSAAPEPVSIDIPAGILRPGANFIEFRASQRHRTDCTVGSTYELWTDIASTDAHIVFSGAGLEHVGQLTELAAVGIDDAGETELRVIAPGLADPRAQAAVLRIVQQVALALRVPELKISLAGAPSGESRMGLLEVAIMPAANLLPEFEAARGQASFGPLAAMLPTGNMLVISGPDWDAIVRAGDAVLAAAPPSPERPRIDLPAPVPLMTGNATESFAALGAERLEFNGRRYAASMRFELPSDFYAYRYDEVDLVLDAAYSSDVLPGSEINIYTNGEIASTTPLLRTDGGLLKDTRIRIPMTNLRPGRNEAVLEVNLETKSDAVCGAGWTGAAPVRFVLSNSSYIHMPDYARAVAVPDLKVLTGTGWPYAGDGAVPLVLGQGQESFVSAMMFAARIATASGKVISFNVVPEAELGPEENGLLVMPTGAMSPFNLSRTGIASAATLSNQKADDALLNEVAGNETGGPFAAPAAWLAENIGLKLADLRLVPQPDLPYEPAPDAVVVSQVLQPEGGIWTVLTSASGPALVGGTERLIDSDTWRQVTGRVSALAPADETVTAVPANKVAIVPPEPYTFSNIRRVAANWFSGNILYFALAIVVGAILLMLATSRVIVRIGRPS